MFGGNKIEKGDRLFKDALANYEEGVLKIDAKNASELKLVEELEKSASIMREKVTVDVANREKEKVRVLGTIENIKKFIGIDSNVALEEK